MDMREAWLKEIADLEEMIKTRRDLIKQHDLEAARRESGTKAMRFFGKPKIDSIREVLREHGCPMTGAELIRILNEGGAVFGEVRSRHNVRLSLETNVKLGNLVKTGPAKIFLPEDLYSLPPEQK